MFRVIATIAFFVLTVCSLCSCQRNHHTVTRAFYYWKTTYNPTTYELNALQQLQVQKMYIRLFDVDWSNATKQAYPVATIRMPDAKGTTFDFVPVIFITQKTLTNLSAKNIPELSERINSLAQAVCSQSAIRPTEIQIDCDWTAKTKDAYFQLLTALKTQPFFSGKTLSCTIRMHQVKYTTSSGIPPVDKGLLMCYNMGNMKKPGTHNSILDADVAKSYLSGIDRYPLPLDIALPLFSWSILFRDKQFVGILRDVYPPALEGSGLFRKLDANRFQCMQDTVWQGYTLAKNDLIHFEEPSQSTIAEIAAYTAKRVGNEKLNVIFFSCDSITLSKHSVHDLEAVYDSYL